MKEKGSRVEKIPNQPSIADAVKKNYKELHGNSCQCNHCLWKFEQQIDFHIISAPLHEQKHITKEILIADMRDIQARARAAEMLAPVKITKKYFEL